MSGFLSARQRSQVVSASREHRSQKVEMPGESKGQGGQPGDRKKQALFHHLPSSFSGRSPHFDGESPRAVADGLRPCRSRGSRFRNG